MEHLSANIRKFRIEKGLTQEELAEYMGITAQSVSKWERSEACPDISALPALANIFGTSIDLLMGMDEIRADETIYGIHDNAVTLQRRGDFDSAEKIYRDALLIYPGRPDMLLGLGCTLALGGKTDEAIALMEKGLALSDDEKQKATARATLCFLYLKAGRKQDANRLASELPHMRESREAVQKTLRRELTPEELNRNISALILGPSSTPC